MELKEWYSSPQKNKIEKRMLVSLSSNISEEIKHVLEAQIFPSKRIRSYILNLLCGDILTQDEFYKISTAIEMFHQATLIFDDVLDDTDIRDGNRISLHNRLGNNRLKDNNSNTGKAYHLAIVLMILAEKELIENGDIEIVSEFNIMRTKMFKAQLADVFFIEKPSNSSYLNWLINESYKKTSSFMEFPFFVYAKSINSSAEETNKLRELGKSIGILYQIGDDLFDMDEGVKKGTLALTYPLSYFLDNLTFLEKNEKSFIEKVLEEKYLNENNSKKITSLYKKHKEIIAKSSKEYFEKYFKIIENSNISKDIKKEIVNLLGKVINPSYWRYML